MARQGMGLLTSIDFALFSWPAWPAMPTFVDVQFKISVGVVGIQQVLNWWSDIYPVSPL